MYISSTSLNQYNNQPYLNRKNYTPFKQDTGVKVEPTLEQTNEKENKNKNIHTIWILALTAFAIADGVWEHRSYKKNKATSEAMQKGKEITDKTLKELEEKTRKIKEDLQKKELELEQLKSRLNKNDKNSSVSEFDKYSEISDKINNAKKH